MRIFTDGAEMQDLAFWDDYSSAITVINAAPAPYASDWCYKMGTGTGTATKNIPAGSEYYFRERWYVASRSVDQRFPTFRLGTTAVAWLCLDATWHPQATATTIGILATATDPLNAGQWYEIEIYFKEANAPDGRFVVNIDGVNVISYSGDTQPAAASTFDNLFFVNGSVSAQCLYLDDLALNDTSNADGLNDNSWCGDGVVVKVYPDGNGTTNDWFNNTGDHVANWSYVDEFPKDDDTTYVYHDGAISGHQDQYSLSHYSFSGKTILRTYPEARCRKTSAAAHTVKLGTLAAGGADVMSPARNLTIGAYTRIVGTDAKVNPVDGNPWEEADIDALEFVIETG
jgi:hypothetical protein